MSPRPWDDRVVHAKIVYDMLTTKTWDEDWFNNRAFMDRLTRYDVKMTINTFPIPPEVDFSYIKPMTPYRFNSNVIHGAACIQSLPVRNKNNEFVGDLDTKQDLVFVLKVPDCVHRTHYNLLFTADDKQISDIDHVSFYVCGAVKEVLGYLQLECKQETYETLNNLFIEVTPDDDE